jgi:hypothetical protein
VQCAQIFLQHAVLALNGLDLRGQLVLLAAESEQVNGRIYRPDTHIEGDSQNQKPSAVDP